MSETLTRTDELRELVTELNEMVLNGQVLEAHDKFYAENCIQQENEGEAVEGKAANRAREEEWLGKVTEFRGAEVKSVSVDEENDVTKTEWFMDYVHAEWGHKRFHQVAVARWEGDKIVHERYYYGA